MSLQKARTRINVKGGDVFKMRQISPTPSDTFVDYGYLTSLEFGDVRDMVESPDAAGNLINANAAGRTVSFTLTLMQTSKEEIDAVAALADKYFDCIYHVQLAVAATYQHLSMVCVKFNPSIQLVFQAGTRREIKLTGYALCPKAAYTRTPTTYNVVAGVPYVFLDDAVAATDPSDTAAATATAVL